MLRGAPLSAALQHEEGGSLDLVANRQPEMKAPAGIGFEDKSGPYKATLELAAQAAR
jgi:hypothetical protein